jgi:hypothetical protein
MVFYGATLALLLLGMRLSRPPRPARPAAASSPTAVA